MTFVDLHPWAVSAAEAKRIQESLRPRVNVSTSFTLPPNAVIAAADVSYNRFSNRIFASVVLWHVERREQVGQHDAWEDTTFPYVPGYLSFREAPALLAAFRKLPTPPAAVLCDGQGVAHPRRMGIASHLGLWLNVPTVGCAKSRLAGTHAEVGPTAGDQQPLMLGGEVVGVAYRSKPRSTPLYVSPGHLIDLPSSLRLVQACLHGYRIPDPLRLAHDAVNAVRRAAG